MAYIDGFQDALELCYAEVKAASDKASAEKAILELLGKGHIKKCERLKKLLDS
jgi:hypothetical protein